MEGPLKIAVDFDGTIVEPDPMDLPFREGAG